MPELIRLSISLEKPLCEKLDKMVKTSGYGNRSEYIRDLIRDRMVSEQWQKSEEVLGTITLIYNHHQRELSEKITDIQHNYHDQVLASTHVHLSHEICAEMIMVKGIAEDISRLADILRQQRGVLHSGLTMSSSGQELR
jgi:CopG family nickel-responsive transcriptional regulator